MALPLAIKAGLTLAPTVIGALQKQKRSPVEGELAASIRESRDLARLMTTPEDPRYQKMLATEKAGIRSDYLRSLRDLIDANRRQALMGRQQIFDPERRDEAVFSAIRRSEGEAQRQAERGLLDRLQRSISGMTGSQTGMARLAEMQNLRGRQQYQDKMALLSALSKGIGEIGQLPSSERTTGAV